MLALAPSPPRLQCLTPHTGKQQTNHNTHLRRLRREILRATREYIDGLATWKQRGNCKGAAASRRVRGRRRRNWSTLYLRDSIAAINYTPDSGREGVCEVCGGILGLLVEA